ncbi:MAG: NERD domain-containing protein [Kiritimatiellae bacterium]|nr:NERD domain-containing protein [Kiritimatiellia bacterium]
MKGNNRVKIHGVPGDEARGRGILRMLGTLMGAVFATGVFIGLLLPRMPSKLVVPALAIIIAVLIYALRNGVKALSSFFKGARGEERVSFTLEALPDGYHVFNDLEGFSAGIDHVVVGERGVFAIETKYWSGKVALDGQRLTLDGKTPQRDALRQAEASAFSVGELLSKKTDQTVECVPVLCFASDTFTPGVTVCGKVTICNVSELIKVINSRSCHLTPTEIGQIVKIIDHNESSPQTN